MNTTQVTNPNISEILPQNYGFQISPSSIDRAVRSLSKNNYTPHRIENRNAALNKIIELIPDNASVMNGASETLREIGFIDYLKSKKHKWINLHEAVLTETDPQKQGLLRRQVVVSDYYLGSAHAISETGEIVIASNTGSQLPHLVFTSPNIILVVGRQKIVPSLTAAFDRLEKYVIPLENNRMQNAYGMNTTHAKTVILHKENPAFGRKIHILIVDEKIGF